MAAFRPLQPAPMDEETPPQPQTRPVLTQKPKRTVTLGACVACRKRKSKCDGSRPVCTCCSQKDTECVYELGPNEKPSQAMKRKNEEMQGELSNLRQLYDYLRFRPEQEALDIFKRIRSNPPDTPASQQIQELAEFVRHGDLLTPQPSFPQPAPFAHDPPRSVTLPPLRLALDSQSRLDPNLYSLPGIHYMGAGDANQGRVNAHHDPLSARLDSSMPMPPRSSLESIIHTSPTSSATDEASDPRLASVGRWTHVTKDTKLLVAILQEWTTREYSYYHYLDKETFLADMESGQRTFCSELLVNSLLATACSTCTAVRDRSKPFSENSIMTGFYREASRLWKQEEGCNTLTRLEAAICLYVFLGKQGRDKEGHTYLREACHIGHQLGFYRDSSQPQPLAPQGVSEEKWSHVCAVTAWALFNFQLTMAFVYKFPPLIKTPPRKPIPYHKGAGFPKALFRSECTRNAILVECIHLFQRPDGSARTKDDLPSLKEVDECYFRLISWWNSRPRSINPDQAPSEENFLCAMIYHTNIIDLFHAFVELESTGRPDPYREHAQRCTAHSLREIRRLLALQEIQHGWASSIGLVLHPISVASFGTLSEISQQYTNMLQAEDGEPYHGLLVCLRALSATCSYIYYAQPLFRLLTQRCQAMNLRLPFELQRGIEAYSSSEWTKTAASLVSSQYIADMRKSTDSAESVRMDAIVSAWENLNLSEASKGRDPGE